MQMSRLILTLGLLGSLALAQPDRPTPLSEADRAALRAEVVAYVEANVWPVVAPARTAFDAHLSEADQRVLAEARTQLEALRAEKRALRSAQDERPREAQRAAHEALRAQREAILEPVRDLAAVHAAALRQTRQDLRPEAESWRTDLRGIFARYAPEDEAEAQNGRRGQRGPQGMHHLRHLLRPAGFLLWTPDQPLLPGTQRPDALTVYPNPAQAEATVQFELEAAAAVTVELLDRSGHVHLSLPAQSLEAGPHTQRLNLRGLEPGVYLVRISGAATRLVGKLVVK